MTRHVRRPLGLSVVLVLMVLAACEIDSGTSLEYLGKRYYGAVIPLSIEPTDLIKIGVPDSNRWLEPSQFEVFSLRDVDPAKVVIIPGAQGAETPYLLFVRDGVFPEASPRPNLFQLVPQLCVYAMPATDGCA